MIVYTVGKDERRNFLVSSYINFCGLGGVKDKVTFMDPYSYLL